MPKNFFTTIISKFKNSSFELYQPYSYLIEEIDIKTHEVIIRFKGRSTIIRSTFEDVISDQEIIDRLPPFQSCLIGGFYGRALRASQCGKDILKKNVISFLLKDSSDQYKIICINRDGRIKYINQKTGLQFIEHPIIIARNEVLISKFKASQACYIGILAGISIERWGGLYDQPKNDMHHLRIVK